jgi:hypothetical protein
VLTVCTAATRIAFVAASAAAGQLPRRAMVGQTVCSGPAPQTSVFFLQNRTPFSRRFIAVEVPGLAPVS